MKKGMNKMNEDKKLLMKKIENMSFEEVKKQLKNTEEYKFRAWEKHDKQRIYVTSKAKKNFNDAFLLEYADEQWIISEPKFWYQCNDVAELI